MTLSRFAAQLVRLLFMMLVGFLLLLLATFVAPDQFTTFSFGADLVVLLVSALVASVFFPQFFGKGSDKLERQILGDRFEYHAQVQNLIQTMRSFPDPQFLMQELQDLLAGTMKMRSYQIILLDDTTRGFQALSLPSAASRTGVRPTCKWIRPSSAISRKPAPSAFPAIWFTKPTTNRLMQREARQQLTPFEPEFCFPFFVGNDLIGLMLLGAKANGDLLRRTTSGC